MNNQNIESIDFVALINNTANKEILNEKLYSKLVERMKDEFTEEQQKWYMANMYMYMNYHPTKDYPINLDNVWKMLGFANKGNAKRTLENNFLEEEDYHIVLLPTEKNLNGGRPKETITLNTDTFKNLCMLAKTDAGKDIRKYYVKLENINHEILKEELDEKNKIIDTLKNKPLVIGFRDRKPGYIYILKDNSKPGHIKIGFSTNTHNRILQLNCGSSTSSIEVYFTYPTFDMEFGEKIIHSALKPLKIQQRNEWFYVNNEKEILYVIHTIEHCLNFIENFNISKLDTYENNIAKLRQIEEINEHGKNVHEAINKYISQRRGATRDAKTGKYKGVFYRKDKNKWESTITKDYGEFFLGYYNTEKEGAIAYNDHAIFFNETKETNYTINYIKDYVPNPRDIILENRTKTLEKETSTYIGVYFDNKKNTYCSNIFYNRKHRHLGCGTELECAILYNKQALFYNNNYETDYDLNIIPGHDNITEENVYDKNQTYLSDKKTSPFVGVRIHGKNRYTAQISVKNRSLYLGSFSKELDAAKAYNEKATELNKTKTGNLYKLNDLTLM